MLIGGMERERRDKEEPFGDLPYRQKCQKWAHSVEVIEETMR